MKLTFPDKSWVECLKSDTPDKIQLTIAAVDRDNPLKKITNSVEISIADLKQLISDVVYLVSPVPEKVEVIEQ
jgi:hypothetical protein